jgi:hypothetical protein
VDCIISRVAAEAGGVSLILTRQIFLVLSRSGSEFGEAGDSQIRFGFGGFDGAYARAGRGTIHPYGREAERLSGNDVVVNALGYV